MRDKNPFQPNSPVYPGMFAGRITEVAEIDKSLFQTHSGNPCHILLVGERGIGKTSLLLFAQSLASGEINLERKQHNYLTIQLNIEERMSLVDFALSLKNRLDRALHRIDPKIELLGKCWEFISSIETSVVSIRKGSPDCTREIEIIEKLMFSLIDTAKYLTEDSLAKDVGFSSKMDGLVVLLDESDKASDNLNLGAFLKNLTELAVSEKCNKILLILAGLPGLRDVLRKSHESSLRLFTEFYLSPLSKDEVREVIERGINEYGRAEKHKIKIEEDAINSIFEYSEGYPHFVQQIGYSSLEVDTDQILDAKDVRLGFFMKHGALECIGDRYYKRIYYTDINTDAQREILDIMAEKWNSWVSRDYIKKHYSKAETSLNNGIKALKEKNIILAKEGAKGQYRLQWASFAFWIKYHKEITEK